MRAITLAVAALALTLSAQAAQAHEICTALADAATGKVLLARGECDRRITPASTFKIAISLMGYDAGFLRDEHTPALPYREAYKAWRPEWKATTDPTQWIAKSVVWYSQQVTTNLGEPRFANYVQSFHYGNEDVSGGLTRAWLSSSLQISPLEQLDFLGRLVRRELPVSAHAYEMTDHLTALPEPIDGWTLHGKTGSGAPRTASGDYDAAHEYGWFVGWATRDGRTVAFAHLVQNEGAVDEPVGVRARRELLQELPALLQAAAR